MEGALGRTPLPGNPKDEVSERYADALLPGFPVYRGPFWEPGGDSFARTFERNEQYI
jgi:hypothetical protein